MGQKSSIDRLPEELRKKLIEMLNNPSVTQAEIVDAINSDAGEPLLSKSSLNRYSQRMKRFAEKNQQAKDISNAYLDKYGDAGNRLGKVVNEQIRLVAFDLISELDELKESKSIKPETVTEIIYKVSRGLKDLEQAEKLNAERSAQIRAEILKETAAKVETVAKKKGVSKEAMKTILSEVFGITE